MPRTITQTETDLGELARDWSDSFPKKLRRSVDTNAEQEVAGITASDSSVKLFAVITNAQEGSRGVAELGTFKIQDLYFNSQAPAVEFSSCIEDLYKVTGAASSAASDAVTLNLEATKVWFKIRDLKTFLGTISDGHDEVVMALLTIATKCKMEPISAGMMSVLHEAIKFTRNKVCYRDEVLDRFQDTLEAGGFSLGIPLVESNEHGIS